MSESEVLVTIAEVAVAFAGFSSLVGVLGQRRSVDDPRVLGVRMRVMLTASLAVVALSFLPIVLVGSGMETVAAWRSSALTLLTASVIIVTWTAFSIKTLGRDAMTRTKVQRFVILPTVFGTLTLLLVLGVMSVVSAGPWVYIAAVLVLLFQSGFAFSHIVFSFLPRLRADESASGHEVE